MSDKERATLYRLHAGFCQVLADASRLLIISELIKGELTVSEITGRLGLRQSNVSKHLGLMRERGLVITRREGVNIYYRLADRRIAEAIKLLMAVQADRIKSEQALINENRETAREA